MTRWRPARRFPSLDRRLPRRLLGGRGDHVRGRARLGVHGSRPRPAGAGGARRRACARADRLADTLTRATGAAPQVPVAPIGVGSLHAFSQGREARPFTGRGLPRTRRRSSRWDPVQLGGGGGHHRAPRRARVHVPGRRRRSRRSRLARGPDGRAGAAVRRARAGVPDRARTPTSARTAGSSQSSTASRRTGTRLPRLRADRDAALRRTIQTDAVRHPRPSGRSIARTTATSTSTSASSTSSSPSSERAEARSPRRTSSPTSTGTTSRT